MLGDYDGEIRTTVHAPRAKVRLASKVWAPANVAVRSTAARVEVGQAARVRGLTP